MSSADTAIATDAEDESIYHLIPRPKVVQAKGPLHKSAFAKFNLPDPTPNKGGGFYGPRASAKTTLSPQVFLRKRANDIVLPEPRKFSYSDRRMPPLPSRVQRAKPDAGTRNGKVPNYVKQNRTMATQQGVQRKEKQHSAARKSQIVSLAEEKKHEEYGRVPKYLTEVKRRVQSEHEYVSQMVAQRKSEKAAQKSQVKMLAEEDRLELLAALKARQAEVNRKYQLMTHLVVLDSMSKVKKKEELESALSHIEKSIEKLSKPQVFVSQFD